VTALVDSSGRVARKLRISVTDRCNFRCLFCMPQTPIWLPRSDILTYEEIHRLVSLFAKTGIERVRLTGGEPLMRKDIEVLVERLSGIQGIRSVAMTTNGFFVAEKATALKDAGLSGLTVSLQSLKPERFREITGGGSLWRVIAGIEAAKENGFKPLKINAVIMRGFNEDEIIDLASLAVSGDVIMRFIEYMPFDGQRLWGVEKVVSGKEILQKLHERWSLVPLPHENGSTAKSYRFVEGAGQIDVISSITEPFCKDCNRIRISADGRIIPCLFDSTEYDLRPLLRADATDQEILDFARNAFLHKAPGVEKLLKEFRAPQHVRPMYTIGG
jgi:cyclic pyranopterin phosphate synthase